MNSKWAKDFDVRSETGNTGQHGGNTGTYRLMQQLSE
jgi:hypothetical protein